MSVKSLQEIKEIAHWPDMSQWCEDEYCTNGTDEIWLPEAEFNRLWLIHSGLGTWNTCPNNDFQFPFTPFYTSTVHHITFRKESMLLKKMEVLMKGYGECICDGWTLLKHPTGCKCSWAANRKNNRQK